MNNIFDIENYFGYVNISGLELVEKMFELFENFGVEYIYGYVENVEDYGDFKKVMIDD